jgi:ATP adenylyltransferase
VRVLWAPWRLSYVADSSRDHSCIFCTLPQREKAASKRELLILASNDRVCVMMNRFPYADGHLMVAPRHHIGDVAALGEALALDVHRQIVRAMAALRAEYRPQGFNVGLNVGKAAGAGYADHLHWHVVPRWEGDTNFMPMLADVRVMPQHLEESYDRLQPHFADPASVG